MPISGLRLIVSDAVDLYQRTSRKRVGRDARLYLVQHAAPEIEEINRRLETGELTTEAITRGIVQLLENADEGRQLPFSLPEDPDDDRQFSMEDDPEFGPLTQEDVARAMGENCPVFPYCVDASQCPH